MAPSTRQQTKAQGEAPPASEAEHGSKHKAADEANAGTNGHDAKRVKTDGTGKQMTIEQSMGMEQESHKPQAPAPSKKKASQRDEETSGSAGKEEATTTETRPSEEDTPSSILEKGVIYFFLRSRVNTDAHASSVPSIARSFLLLRPLPDKNATLSPTSPPAKKARLLVVPKKVLPTSGRDRFLAFVEKSGASFPELRDEFLGASEYETKTAGTSHVPPATPVGEGVYAITHTGSGRGTTHLVYVLTLPRSGNGKEVELGEVQREMGIKERGSFALSTKNPKVGGGGAAGKADVDYPDEVQKEFGSLRWLPTTPEHLDFPNAQVLLIGESDGGKKGLETQDEDKKDGVQEPAEEMEKLEEEDLARLQKMSDDDAGKIYADLQVEAKDYPALQTEF